MRHKILDIIGDIALLGVKLKAHIVAVRPGHALNAKLTEKIYKQMESLKNIDRITETRGNTELTAIKNVTLNEQFFQGHFPGNPVMPGVLQLEAMAQAAGILMLRQIDGEDKLAFFMSADKVKFRRAVKPGDQLQIDVKITKNRDGKIACAEGTCKVAGKVVSSADLMFAIMDAADAP